MTSAGKTTQKTILVVEDNASARMALEALLDALGLRVLAAGDANEAQAIFAAHGDAIDLLISDMLLPRINGPELYDLLKQRKPGLQCVLISGYPLEDERERLHRHGIRHWVQKPFNVSDIQALVDSLLGE